MLWNTAFGPSVRLSIALLPAGPERKVVQISTSKLMAIPWTRLRELLWDEWWTTRHTCWQCL